MGAPNILAAIGAALTQGGRTYGALTEDERQRALVAQERQDRLAQQEHQNQFESQRMAMDQKRFDADENERKARRIQQAIEGIAPGQEVGADIIKEVQDTAPELMSRFSKQASGTMTGGVAAGGGLGFLGSTPNFEDHFTRNATLEEKGALANLQDRTDKKTEEDIFRTYMGGEGAKKSYDERAAFAIAHGQQPPPKTFADREKEENADFGRRERELGIMYPANRFGGKAKSEGAQWLQGYNMIEDNVRQKYGPQLNALAKASAEGIDSGADAKMAALEARISQEAEEQTTRLIGPRPNAKVGPEEAGAGADATEHLLSTIDSDAKEYGGDYNSMLADVMKNQAMLRSKGVNVPAYVRAINSRAQGMKRSPNLGEQILDAGSKLFQNESGYASQLGNGFSQFGNAIDATGTAQNNLRKLRNGQ